MGVCEVRARDAHLVRRFSGGLTPALTDDVTAAGSGRAWFERQLTPSNIPDSGATAMRSWFPTLSLTPQEIARRHRDGTQGAWEVMYDLARWTLLRRIYSSRQVHEVMVEFWSNLLHVPLLHERAWFQRLAYDATIRAHALGSFSTLLHRAVLHPAMGLYLDNAVSTKTTLNENLGREVLELHTVGVDAGYTQTDVRHSARLLTGYLVDFTTMTAHYDPAAHATGRITVMGFEDANATPDGRVATRRYLSYLARHPRTARRLARRLCVKFVSDSPSPQIVRAVAQAYLDHDTAITPTLRALVSHPDFAAATWAKLRTPSEDIVATMRALGVTALPPTSAQSLANVLYRLSRDHGQAPFDWPSPDGFPETNGPWLSCGRLLSGVTLHRALTGHWTEFADAQYPPAGDWLPALPATLGEAIDRIGARLFGSLPTPDERIGAAQARALTLDQRVVDPDPVIVYGMVAALLNGPTHLKR